MKQTPAAGSVNCVIVCDGNSDFTALTYRVNAHVNVRHI